MGSKTKTRTISSVVDTRIRLTNSNFARLWSADVGTNWTTIRVGCRVSVEDSGTSLTSTPRFAFGICSGTSNIFMDATTSNWIGLVTYGGTWTRSTSPTKYMLGNGSYFDSGIAAAKRVGSTLTTDAFTNSPFPGATYLFDATVNRVALFVDITKGSPNFTVRPTYYKTSAANDVSVDTFLSQVAVSVPSITGHQYGNETKSIAIDEATNGFFNAINVAWDRTSPAIEISDIAVVKLA